MADAKTEKQKVQEITEKLEQGIKELFESEKYKTYLNTMSKFHNYQDTVEDREAQVANITEDIRNGNTGYLNDTFSMRTFLKASERALRTFSDRVWRLMTAKRFRLREGQRSCLTSWQNTSRLQRWRSLKNRITT